MQCNVKKGYFEYISEFTGVEKAESILNTINSTLYIFNVFDNTYTHIEMQLI